MQNKIEYSAHDPKDNPIQLAAAARVSTKVDSAENIVRTTTTKPAMKTEISDQNIHLVSDP